MGSDAAADVFVNQASSWEHVVTLTGSNSAPDDGFGTSISIDRHRIVVGAWNKRNAAGVATGAAYVFELSYGSWSERSVLTPEADAKEVGFGGAVAISLDHAIVGASAGGEESVVTTPTGEARL